MLILVPASFTPKRPLPPKHSMPGAVPPGGAQLAGHRVAQYIRAYLDSAYQVTPPFAEWELELHGP
jgi:hypothetical protein